MYRTIRREWQINKYNWMSLAGVLGYMLAAQALHQLTVPAWVAWGVFLVGLAVSIGRCVVGLWLDGKPSVPWFDVFKIAEILLITTAIGVTGGIRSELWLLYFMVMIYYSLYSPPRAKRLLDLYILLLYLAATLPCQWLLPHRLPAPLFMLLLSTRLFFLILVSALARRVSNNTQAQDRELMLLREQMAAGEERAHIAREIHDGLGQAMVSAILRLELCARLLRRDPEQAEALLKEEIPALRAAWNEGRDMAFHLRPWETDASTATPRLLSTALRHHAGRFAERTGITVQVVVEGSEFALSPAVTYGLTRIVQEALTNAARHAACSNIIIRLRYASDGACTCEIADDGAGFDMTVTRTGVGLQTMRERAGQLGGTLQLRSGPGQGTSILVELPG